jgi:hypothetical protein
MIDCVAIIREMIMGNERYGEQAQIQAQKWGFEGDLATVTRTYQPDARKCKWIVVHDEGICVTCRDIDLGCKEAE